MTYKQIKEVHAKVADYVRRHETLTYYQMSAELGISVPMISKIARAHGIERRPAVTRTRTAQTVSALLAKLEE
jgi:uncharacterized protein YerC